MKRVRDIIRWYLLVLFVITLTMCSQAKTAGESDDTESDTGSVDGDTDGDMDSDADNDADTDSDADADNDADTDSDADADNDTDTDSDADADNDTDTDSDADVDNDTDTDSDVDVDADGDTDTDSDSDTDADTDADTDVLDTDTDGDIDTNTVTETDTDTDTEYHPCPTDGSPCKILPLGDSITWGVGDESNAGYRAPLFALAIAAQQSIDFTGSRSNGPGTVSGQPFPTKNEGHSGWGISTVTDWSDGNAGIATVIPSPAFDSGSGGLPHIICLHIGTNDANDSTEPTAAEMTERLGGLMDKIMNEAPDALLVVAKIIPLSWETTVINAYNDAIAGLVEKRAVKGRHVMLVDMNTGFNPSSMLDSDNIHPNSVGYQFMAERWYSVIESLLPKQ